MTYIVVLKNGQKLEIPWVGRGSLIDVFVEAVKSSDSPHALFTVTGVEGGAVATVIRLPEIAAIIAKYAMSRGAVHMSRDDSRVDEIMRRRWWFPRFMGSSNGVQRWTVFSWAGVRDLGETLPVWFEFPDNDPFIRESPVESLIAADDWFKANVDKEKA